jgi:hypothetical protein
LRGTKAKQIRRRAEDITIEWLHSMVPEGEDTSKINKNNLKDFLPKETHLYANSSIRLYSMTPKWVAKQLKKNPKITLKELTNA